MLSGKIPTVYYYVQQCFHFLTLVCIFLLTIKVITYLVLLLTKEDLITRRSEIFPLRVTGWPVELMAYAFLVVSPPDMIQCFEEVSTVILHRLFKKNRIEC